MLSMGASDWVTMGYVRLSGADRHCRTPILKETGVLEIR